VEGSVENVGQIKKHSTESFGGVRYRGVSVKKSVVSKWSETKSFAKRSSHCLTPRPPGCLQETCKVLRDSEMVMKSLSLNCVDLAWNVPQGCGP